MTTTTLAQPTIKIEATAIVYHVSTLRPADVTVNKTATGVYYQCSCKAFPLYGSCEHAQAVERQRNAQGRK